VPDPKIRRSLTPSTAGTAAPGGLHETRRGGARHELTARISLTAKDGRVLEGWALNVSRGGVRVILEENVELGVEFEIVFSTGENAGTPFVGRVVWVQEEPDGVVAGIEFR
jgi:hypothetical protein